MARTPPTATLYRQLQEITSRMDTAEALLKEHGHEIDVLKRWHEDTDFAKKLLEEYQEKHPEVNEGKPVIGSYKWMLATLLGIIMALIGAFIATK